MAKTYITLDTRIDSFKDEFNNLVNKVGDIAVMSTSGTDSDVVGGVNNLDSDLGTRANLTTTADQNLVVAINEHDAELGTITAGAMGTTASTVSTAILELDTEADSDRNNLAANVKKLMLDDGVSKEITSTANNADETTFITFVDGATGAQGIETDTGLTYNPSSGLITATSLAAATLDISGNVDIDGTLEVGAISGTSADFDAGVTIDNLTIDGTSVASSSTLTLDAAGDIAIDAGGAEINLKDDGTTVGHISMASSNLEIKSSVSDKDMIFKGNDGGSEITALTLDMSDAGKATFNNTITTTGLILGSTALTSTADELNKLDGVLTTTAEFNIMDGDTTATSTTIADADRVIVNDGGTMKQVAVTDLAAYFDDEITAMPNLVTTAATTVGALSSGSIDSNFGSINVGSSSITTTGAISGGSVTVGGAALNSTELGILDGAEVTTNELNILKGATSGSSITVADADRFVMNDGGVMKQVNASLLKTYFGTITGGTAITTLDIDGATDIGAAIVDSDLFIINDGASGDVQRKTSASRLLTYAMAGTLTEETQTGITKLGILDSAQINNIKIKGNEISTLAGTDLLITPLAGQQIVLDNQIVVDAGVVTGATSITSTAFVGALTGSITGTAPVATTVTLNATDSSLDTEQFITFVDTATGNEGIRTDTGLKYNPATNTLTAATFNGAVTGGITGNAATATKLAATKTFTLSGDVTASAQAFDGSSNIELSTSIASGQVARGSIADSAIDGGLIDNDAIVARHIADDVINSEHYVNASIDAEHIANNTITATQIAANAIGNSELGTNAVEQVNVADDAIGQTELKTLRTFTLKDSSGSTLFTMFGAGA